MTVNSNEILALVHRLRVNFETSDGAIWSLRMNDDDSVIHMCKKAFLSEFIDFEIEVYEGENPHPYKLVSCVDGVSFFAFMDAAEVVDLRSTMPDQWEYIQYKLQVDVA